MFPMNRSHHGLLIDSHHHAIGHGVCRAHAEGLACKTAFSEKIALVQNRNRGFLAGLGQDVKSDLAFLNVKDGIGRVALNKDDLTCGKSCYCPAVLDGRKEGLGIESRAFLNRLIWSYG
jgi:hypothetical protein